MRTQRPSFPRCAFFFAVAFAFCSLPAARAQTASVTPVSQDRAPQARITQAIDEKNLVILRGNVHPLARAEYDQGPAAEAQPLNRILLLLQRGPDQEAALRKLLQDQQDKFSPNNYHAWLTPEQFGKQFGPADADLQAVTNWLSSQGFSDIKIGPGRTALEFSGNVASVRRAFHTEIHQYSVNGEEHFANATDPQVPAALAPVAAGLVSLHNFGRRAHARYLGEFRRSKVTGETNPLFTFPIPGSSSSFYGLGPADFAKIYNVEQLWSAGIDGTGQTIAIVGETNLNLQDVQDFRKVFGLPQNDPQIVLNGEDPGITSKGEEAEADLDVQWSGAVAKNATIKFVVSASTPVSSGVDLSALYIVENNLASVMSESYGECEQNLGATGNQFFNELWKQAAAQGITVIVSSGDGGSAGCDDFNNQLTATHGLAVSGLAGTPYNVSVGGTDFDQINKWSLYWNSTNDPTTQLSAKSYIPEIPWNENCAQLGLSGCGSSAPQGLMNIVAASGGPSTVYGKPAWQLGVAGMPNDNHRDQPDVSLFASAGFTGTGYIYCQQDQNSSGIRACDLNTTSYYLDFHGIGGTSASAPAFAGIMALVDQKMGSRQGNANQVLYALAKKPNANCNASLPATITNTACTFYDVTKGDSYFPSGVGTNSVPCTGGSLNCSSLSPNVNGVLVDPKKTSTEAWTAAVGYDMAAGLGSVNAYNLATNWGTASTLATKTTLTLSPTTGIQHGQSENVSVTIDVAPASGTGQPSGDVSLIATLQDGVTTRGLDSFTLINGGVAGQKTQNLPGGTYQVTAHYAGDGTYAPSDSSSVSITVGQEASQTFIVVPTFDAQTGQGTNGNATSMVYGTPAFVRMYVTNAGSAANPTGPPSPVCQQVNQMTCPSGTVTLTDNGNPLDAGTFSLNDAGYTRDLRPFLVGGTHQLVAQYSGDSSYTKSTSATDTVTVTPAPSQTYFNYFPNFVLVGQAFTLSFSTQMSVLGGKTPTGSYKLYDGATELTSSVTTYATGDIPQSTPYIYGYATITLSTVGPHTLSIVYSGDANYASSTSNPQQVTAQYQVTLSVSADSTSVLYGSPVNVTATITTDHSAPPLGGNVSFYSSLTPVNGAIATTLATDNGGNQVLTATVTTAPLGSEVIFVDYSGDTNYTGSSGNVFINVTIPDFRIDIPNPVLITAGQSASQQINVVPLSNNPSPVTLSCGGLGLAGYTCNIQPNIVNLANGAPSPTTITFTPRPSGAAVSGTALKSRHTGLFAWPIEPQPFSFATLLGAWCALLFLVWPRNRRRLRAALAVGGACAISIAVLLGCGGGSSLSVGTGGGGRSLPSQTSTTLSISASSVAQNTPLILTAKVSGHGNPTGTVTFYDLNGGGWFASADLVSGVATVTTSISYPGLYSVVAGYNGDFNNLPSTSPALREVVSGSMQIQVYGYTSTLSHTANLTVTLQ